MQMYTNLSTEIIKIPKTGCSHNTIPFLLLFPCQAQQKVYFCKKLIYMKKVSLLSIIALISCLYSCNFKNNHSNETNADSVVVEKLVIADTYHLSGDTAKPACKVVLTMEIPVKYKQDSDYLHLQKILSPLTFGDEYTGDSLKQAAQKVVESHVNAYKEIEPEFEKELAKSGEAYSFEWDFDYTLSPVYNRNDFFCYGISSSEYTGGAHGMYSNRYYTIDLSNWKRIGLDDIFQPDSSDTLSSILLNRLMKQLNVSSPDSLLELGYFDTEDIMATENFYLTDTGICWVYNPYEIACYATGQTSIEIPFKEIDSYILPDSPVRRLIK
ncbi:DUF3298 domain-containing protein [Barnesiella intestinihominis]|nr:DUF3298 domain-containing protein [Barnesiella intestinihominis]